MNGFMEGINLGGWFSQCDYSPERLENFIRRDDFAVIAGRGCDHVRLPFDYNIVQEETGALIPKGFDYLCRAFDWAREAGLNVVFDLHKTAGFSFDSVEGESGRFFYDEVLIGRFLAIWAEMARRFAADTGHVAFELLNEVTDPADNAAWMRAAKRAVDVIREDAKDVPILIGGYYNNHASAVKDIALPFDGHILYSFHCYDPLLFTHQGAHWVSGMPLDFRMHYPMTKAEYLRAGRSLGLLDHDDAGGSVPEAGFGPGYFENLWAEAIRVAKERGVELYCGEYGVIALADKRDRENWLRDIHAAFDAHGIGHALWTYRAMDFGE